MLGDLSLLSPSLDLLGAGLSFLLSNTFFFKAELLNFDFLFSVDADNFGFFLPSFFDKVFTFFMTGFPFLATTLDFNFGVFSSVLDELVSLRCFLELLDNLVFLLGGVALSCSSDEDEDEDDPESDDELEEDDDEEDCFLALSCLGGVAATTFESNFFAAAWSFSESELPLFSLSSRSKICLFFSNIFSSS